MTRGAESVVVLLGAAVVVGAVFYLTSKGTVSMGQPVGVGGIGNTKPDTSTPPASGANPDVLALCRGAPSPFGPGCLGSTWMVDPMSGMPTRIGGTA